MKKKIKKMFTAMLAASVIFALGSCNQDVPEEDSKTTNSGYNAEDGDNSGTPNNSEDGSNNTEDYTTTPVVMAAGTTGSAGTDATYVLFGEWPQTLKKLGVTVDENDSKTVGAFTYYKGSDGSWYVKCLENALGSSYTYEGTTTTVKQADANSYQYFKVEPIKWRVMATDYDYDGDGTDTAKLLVAENIVTGNIPYYEYNDYGYTRTVGTDTNIYHNNYKYSQIRAYLNGLDYYYDTSASETTKINTYTSKGFLQSAFTVVAQEKIKITTVKNDGLSTQDVEKIQCRADGYEADGTTSSGDPDYTCADTEDKIFLLSEYEVTKYSSEAYNAYGKGNSRIRKPTDYAKANYAYQSVTDGWGGVWWLRSPDYFGSCCARHVRDGGIANNYHYVLDTWDGVVPALSISF